MKAVVCQNADLAVVERPEPTPGRGQVRLNVVRCGICGSDLHARHGIDQWADMAERMGYDRFGRSSQPLVFGHEFSGEVAEYGPGCKQEVPTAPITATSRCWSQHPGSAGSTPTRWRRRSATSSGSVACEALRLPRPLPAGLPIGLK